MRVVLQKKLLKKEDLGDTFPWASQHRFPEDAYPGNVSALVIVICLVMCLDQF
jgi:hypothetical protein